MKKILILTIALLFVIGAMAQNKRGRTITPNPETTSGDSINGNETVNFGAFRMTVAAETLTLQALCTEVGGTTDGQLMIQGSVDGTTYSTLTTQTGVVMYFPNNDTLTMTSGASLQVVIQNPGFAWYRWRATGTANDSTLILAKYIYK